MDGGRAEDVGVTDRRGGAQLKVGGRQSEKQIRGSPLLQAQDHLPSSSSLTAPILSGATAVSGWKEAEVEEEKEEEAAHADTITPNPLNFCLRREPNERCLSFRVSPKEVQVCLQGDLSSFSSPTNHIRATMLLIISELRGAKCSRS